MKRPLWVLLTLVFLLYEIVSTLSAVHDSVTDSFSQFFLGVQVPSVVFVLLGFVLAVIYCLALLALFAGKKLGYWLLLGVLLFSAVNAFVALTATDQIVAANKAQLAIMGMQQGAIVSDSPIGAAGEQEAYFGMVKVVMMLSSGLEGVVSVILLLFIAGKNDYFQKQSAFISLFTSTPVTTTASSISSISLRKPRKTKARRG